MFFKRVFTHLSGFYLGKEFDGKSERNFSLGKIERLLRGGG
jgi:hypothetical protein